MIGRIWSALLSAAPVRLWAQIIAAGSFLGFIVATSAYIRFGSWSPAVEAKRVDALFWLGIAVAFLLLFALAAITEQKFGIRATRDGFNADVERDDDPPTTTVETTVTVTESTK
jgi:hypothetical protein